MTGTSEQLMVLYDLFMTTSQPSITVQETRNILWQKVHDLVSPLLTLKELKREKCMLWRVCYGPKWKNTCYIVWPLLSLNGQAILFAFVIEINVVRH